MPVKVLRVRNKYRVVDEETGKISRALRGDGKPGRPSDGGGHDDKEKAERQAGHINEPKPSKDSERTIVRPRRGQAGNPAQYRPRQHKPGSVPRSGISR